MGFLNDVWQHLLPMINWVVFVMVLASGYFIRVTPILKNWNTTVKVLICSSIATTTYVTLAKADVSVFIATYFIAFGFHSAILKLIEKLIENLFYSKTRNLQSKPKDGAISPDKGM